MKVKTNKGVAQENPRQTLLDMLSIISHNVKGPIKYIQFITDYNLEHWEKVTPNELRECAQIINESAKDITNLLANMMHWASLQKNELVKHDSTFDLHGVITDEIAKLVVSNANEKEFNGKDSVKGKSITKENPNNKAY